MTQKPVCPWPADERNGRAAGEHLGQAALQMRTGGAKHPQYYFSVNIDRKTKIIYLRKEMRMEAEEYVKHYKLLWDIVEEMTLLNFELLKSKSLSLKSAKVQRTSER
jgi:hypothetical protein